MALSALLDLSAARTVVPTRTDVFTVEALLPGHAAYARVMNPAHDSSGTARTWRSLTDGPLDPAVQWNELHSTYSQTRDLAEPEMGTIDPEIAAELVRPLEPRTTTPDQCVFLVWEGYAGMNQVVTSAPKITISFENRTMHVLQGAVHDALETVDDHAWSSRLPLWWLPLDHAWSVGNDLYGRSVYVGGSDDTIRALINSPHLEALPVTPGHEVYSEDL
jgi:hypothetical protein